MQYCSAAPPPPCAMFLRSEAPPAGHDRLITPNTEFLMSHYGLPFSGSGSISANRWNGVLPGHRLQRQNISADPPSISCLPNEKKKEKEKPLQGIKSAISELDPDPLMSLWNACEMDCIFQKPSICFRVRLKLISTALKGFADIPDKEEQPYVTLFFSHRPLNLFVPHYRCNLIRTHSGH